MKSITNYLLKKPIKIKQNKADVTVPQNYMNIATYYSIHCTLYQAYIVYNIALLDISLTTVPF